MTKKIETETRILARRDSATSLLRKLGVKPTDYNIFITPNGDGSVTCNVQLAKDHVAGKLKAPVTTKAEDKPLKPHQKALKAMREADAKVAERTVSTVARKLILDGASNAEVWKQLKTEFGLDDKKRSYPAWYRSELKRTGKLPAKAA